MPIEVGDLALFTEGEYAGWIMWRHPDGQWVTAKKANMLDLTAFEAIRILRIECARKRSELLLKGVPMPDRKPITLMLHSWLNLIECLHHKDTRIYAKGNFWSVVQHIESQIGKYSEVERATMVEESFDECPKCDPSSPKGTPVVDESTSMHIERGDVSFFDKGD